MRPETLNYLAFGTVLCVVGIYRRWASTLPNIGSQTKDVLIKRIRFVLDSRSNEILLNDSEFIKWLDQHPSRNLTCAMIQQTMCRVHTSNGSGYNTACDRSNRMISYNDKDCATHLNGSLGQFPGVTNTNPNASRIPSTPAAYQPSSIYVDQSNSKNAKLNCKINLKVRQLMYELLRYWISLAEKYNIVWWIGDGSLLGSTRDGDFIPYDHDADIIVLESAEPIIRSLATERRNANSQKISLITREQGFCAHDQTTRMNCQGVPVRFQLDTCGFCTPLARLVTGYFTFFDIFLARMEIHMKTNGTVVQMGLFDEGANLDPLSDSKLTHSVEDIFPLSTCRFIGLNVPCPRNPHVVLSRLYGENYKRPNKMCNPDTGYWSRS